MSELSVGTLSGLAANGYVIDVASGSQLTQPGMILQVVSATYSTATTISSTSYAETGLTASITPTSATSKILVITNQSGGLGDESSVGQLVGRVGLVRDATTIYEVSSILRTRASASTEQAAFPGSITYLDSPATTSSVTYKTQAKVSPPAGTTGYAYFQVLDTSSSITLLEVAV